MSRTHTKKYFYKYVTAIAAERILESGKFLWKAPHLFNDPFDHQTSYLFPFTKLEFSKKLSEAQERFVFGKEEPIVINQAPLGFIAMHLRKNRSQIIDKGEWIDTFKKGADEAAEGLDKYQKDFNDTHVNFLSHSRVLCVSEVKENVVMWSHYADLHQGAVIKLNCVDQVDDNLLIARPVTYTERFPEFLPLEDWVDSFLGLKNIDRQKMYFDLAFLKHKNWSYECEWRVHIPLLSGDSEGDGTTLIDKHPSVFGALYLGCRMHKDVQTKLIDIAIKKYPHMEIYHATKSKSSFALEFERII